MTLQGPIRIPSDRALPSRRLPVRDCQQGDTSSWSVNSDLLLELLVNGIQCIFDCNALQVSCGDLKAKREMEINLLDRWSGQELLQDAWVFYRAC